VLYYFIAFSICFFDQIGKFYIEKFVSSYSSIPVVSEVFHLTLVYNTGIAFGLFKEYPFVFTILTILAIILIVYFLNQKKHKLNVSEKIALCFILGGSAGNLIDRLRYGHIVDFIDFRFWPVFNIADSFITIGAVILIFSMLFKRKN